MQIYKAHQQWKNRPADERFKTILDLYDATKHYADQAAERTVPWDEVRVEDLNGDLRLIGKAGIPATLTNWAFGQMCGRVGAPANYLRELPATLAAQNLNHGLKNKSEDSSRDAKLLFHQNGGLVLRSITSEIYERIWDWEVANRLLDWEAMGWEPAVPDEGRIWDESQRGVTALYASDHDLWCFLRLKDNYIQEVGSDKPIYKGLIIGNSEVGNSSLFGMKFNYREMCGNHIIWGAEGVTEFRIKHVGDARGRFKTYQAAIREYANESVSDIEAKIKSSKETLIGATKEEVLDAVFGKRNLGLTRKLLSAGYDACIEEQDGSPRTTWGLVQGLTRHSQTIPYADQRTAIDKGAAKLLEAF